MTFLVPGGRPLVACLAEDVLNAIELLVDKNVDIYNELNSNPPLPGWKQGLEEVWN